MTTTVDPYREWDAAYVMGSLSPADRHAFEAHLAECDLCARNVADLAGLPGILSVVPADQAALLLHDQPELPPTEVPPATLLPGVFDLAEQRERKRRRRTIWLSAGAAVAAACIALAVTLVATDTLSFGTSPHSERIAMEQTVPSPITADAELVEQSWGTEIKLTCRYAMPTASPTPGAPTGPFEYSFYVTDTDGVTSQAGNWTASPGSTVDPVITTKLRLEEIDRIEIRFVPLDVVILTASP
jgi:hypothetical protein